MTPTGHAQRLTEVLKAFLMLGLTSFGGPIAHLGYFRSEFVQRRRWLSEESYGDLVALCQFLPGPASSQVGFALGLQRAGLPGALAAWSAFTLPSALLLMLFAYSAATLQGPIGQGLVHGLKLVAVAVVAQAVWGMARNLCPDRQRASIAVGAVILVVILPTAIGHISAILVGGMLGLWLCRGIGIGIGSGSGSANKRNILLSFSVTKPVARFSAALFVALLLGLPLLAGVFHHQGLVLFEAFYRTGALVFGGGHVVLPLLEGTVVESGWASENTFLAGYGAAQAIPGPLFTFSAYLGAVITPEPNGVVGAVIALVAIFSPGMLLLLAVLPHWDELRKKNTARAGMAGANAAVVGILGAALYDPVWTSAIFSPLDFAVASTAFVLLTAWRLAPWIVVLITALAELLVTVL